MRSVYICTKLHQEDGTPNCQALVWKRQQMINSCLHMWLLYSMIVTIIVSLLLVCSIPPLPLYQCDRRSRGLRFPKTFDTMKLGLFPPKSGKFLIKTDFLLVNFFDNSHTHSITYSFHILVTAFRCYHRFCVTCYIRQHIFKIFEYINFWAHFNMLMHSGVICITFCLSFILESIRLGLNKMKPKRDMKIPFRTCIC